MTKWFVVLTIVGMMVVIGGADDNDYVAPKRMTHVVEKGDTLWDLAKHYFGNFYCWKAFGWEGDQRLLPVGHELQWTDGECDPLTPIYPTPIPTATEPATESHAYSEPIIQTSTPIPPVIITTIAPTIQWIPEETPNPPKAEGQPDNDIYFRNCTEARNAGYRNIRRGQPGYSRKLDRDGDGVACQG